MKPISSAITTPQREVGSAIGTPLGGRGLATQENSRVAAWLAKQAPADMDKAAVSRASQHGVGLRVKYEGRYPEGQPAYVVATACEVSPGGDHDAALADLRNFLTSAPIRQIEAWLAELSVLVAKRQGDEMEEGLRLTAYASRLSRYPADVARAVTIGASYKFWPTWEEMERRCEAMTTPRRVMIAALERGPQPPAPEYRAPTAGERERIQDLIDEMFPRGSAEEKQAAMDLAMARVKMPTGKMAGGDL
jgi:hypothetical protein